MNSKNNKGAQRTRSAIRAAFLDLLEEKSIREVTVNEIVQKAQISRGSFYVHYHDIYDLLEEMEREALEEITAIFDGYFPQSASHEADNPLKMFFSVIKKNSAICKVLLGENGDIAFLNQVIELLKKTFRRNMTIMFGTLDPQEFEVFYAFVVAGYIGLLRIWLADGCKADLDSMADTVARVILHGAEGLSADCELRQQPGTSDARTAHLGDTAIVARQVV